MKMKTPRRILDPDGDVLIVLKNPYPPFAPWPDTWGHGEEDPLGAETPLPYDFEFLASSKSLTRDSDYFRAALNGPWHHEEVAPDITKSEIKDLDEEALTIVLRIIHGRSNPCLGSHMTLELVAKVALVADYLQCQEAVSEVVETWTWMQELTDPLYECYEVTRDIVLWIFISTIFRLEEDFGCSVRLAMEIGTGPIQTMGLPIPERIVSEIERRRNLAITEAFEAIITMGEEFRGEYYGVFLGCNYRCHIALRRVFENEFDIDELRKQRPFKEGEYTFREVEDLTLPLQPPCELHHKYRWHEPPVESLKIYNTEIFEAHRRRFTRYCRFAQTLGNMIGGERWGELLNVCVFEFFPRYVRIGEESQAQWAKVWNGLAKDGEWYWVGRREREEEQWDWEERQV